MKKFMSTPIATVALFALAALLLGFGGVNAIQAAPRIESSDYRAQVKLSNINVAIVERYKNSEGEVLPSDEGEVLPTDGELLTELKKDLKANKQQFQIGKPYDEILSVRNTSRPGEKSNGEGIPEYVRVTVYRYWTDDTGKAVDLDPRYIMIDFVTDNGWVIDTSASTPERTVLYYAGNDEDKGIVPVHTETESGETPPFANKLTINSAVATAMANGEYQYYNDENRNVEFHIKVTADAVQTHNGEQAMMSAWGRTNSREAEQ